jgi:FKBP-type peptidyl-prolyl cis-trans isomerase FkpA
MVCIQLYLRNFYYPMRKVFFAPLLLVLLFAGCSKKDNTCEFDPCGVKAPTSEITQLESYLSGAGITTATKHCSGMYYQVLSAGADKTPGICSYVSVYYKGMFTNGNVFDQTTTGPAAFTPISLIDGWKIGIPLIKKGGKIRLFVPPTLGYGATDRNGIPGNSILIFDIELLEVQ